MHGLIHNVNSANTKHYNKLHCSMSTERQRLSLRKDSCSTNIEYNIQNDCRT